MRKLGCVLAGILLLVKMAGAATYTVTSITDAGGNTYTLRGAIENANLDAAADTILFNTPGGNSITVVSVLTISQPLTIDGGGTQIVGGDNQADNIFMINGDPAPTVLITRLALVSAYRAIHINGGNVTVTQCRIGTDWNDNNGRGNNVGIFLGGGNTCVIGGSAADRNVISGNYSGIELNYCTGKVIKNNFIGVASDGDSALPNYRGIYLAYSWNNTIGGLKATEYNVISNNTAYGISLYSSNNNVICGNRIGLYADGTAAAPNNDGVHIYGTSSGNRIGAYDPLYANIISGNSNSGIISYANTGGNTIVGNWIGANAAGNATISNNVGIQVYGNSGNYLIGGVVANSANYICDGNVGVFMDNAFGNTIVGNFFGLLPNGEKSTLVGEQALFLGNTSHHNSIGLKGIMGNLITATNTGIQLFGANVVSNAMYGNTICGFSSNGISIESGANASKSAPVITEAGANLIRGTSAAGDYIEVFLSDRGSGVAGGSLRLLGSAVAVGSVWEIVPTGLNAGEYITGQATDTFKNTSAFCNNVLVTAAIPTSTPTNTATESPTASITPTFTPTLSNTPTLSTTPTPTITQTCTQTLIVTSTVTPSITATTVLSDWKGGRVQVFPNPAKKNMTFAVRLDNPGGLVISLFNLSGERIARLQEHAVAGTVYLAWDCGKIAPGIYLAQVTLDNKEIKKIKIAIAR